MIWEKRGKAKQSGEASPQRAGNLSRFFFFLGKKVIIFVFVCFSRSLSLSLHLRLRLIVRSLAQCCQTIYPGFGKFTSIFMNQSVAVDDFDRLTLSALDWIG